MIWIVATIALIILVIVYFIFNKKDKQQLNKLRSAYDERKEETSGIKSTSEGLGTEGRSERGFGGTISSSERKPNNEGNVQPGERPVLPTSVNRIPSEINGRSRTDTNINGDIHEDTKSNTRINKSIARKLIRRNKGRKYSL